MLRLKKCRPNADAIVATHVRMEARKDSVTHPHAERDGYNGMRNTKIWNYAESVLAEACGAEKWPCGRAVRTIVAKA